LERASIRIRAVTSPSDSPVSVPRGRRLSPDARREHILEAARQVFATRPYAAVTTKDIADAAGVARSLVHHYFGGIAEVFMAVVAQGGAALDDVRSAGVETPFAQRVAHNVAAGLDVVAANRETWLAAVGHGPDGPDPRIGALVVAIRDRFVDRTLALNADLIDDTPTARFALRCFNAFLAEATRAWLLGEVTREETEALLCAAVNDLVTRTIPALRDPGLS
jgi:AcrR family transcriptional regulator